MKRERTGIERLFKQKIERTIFSPLSDEELDREILWLSKIQYPKFAGEEGKNYIEKILAKENPKDYTAFCILKRAGLIKENGDSYSLTEDGSAVHSSLVDEGVYGRFSFL